MAMELDAHRSQGLVQENPHDGLIVALGRTLDWEQAGYGAFVEHASQVFASREVQAIAGADEIDLRGSPTVWEAMRCTAFALLSGAAFMPGVNAVELRYVAEPRPGQPTRLRMYITTKSAMGVRGVLTPRHPEVVRSLVEL